MANKYKREIQEKEAERKRSSFQSSLREAQAKHVRLPKKKSPRQLYYALNLTPFETRTIRPVDEYPVKSYNEERQRKDLIRHLFVKYPVPDFMYSLFLSRKSTGVIGAYGVVEGDFFEWFFCLAQGGSLQKMMKEVMTKKEVIEFLRSPDYLNVANAFWFAKAKHMGVAVRTINALIDRRMFEGRNPTAAQVQQMVHVLDFYAKYHEDMDERIFGEITDFIKYKIAAEPEWSLRGRTLNSVTVLSNEWHNLMVKASYGQKVSWRGKNLKPWYKEEKECIWEVAELKTNHDIINEGRKQKHCVSSYVSSCLNGSVNIFSLRRFHPESLEEYTKNRITIELRNKSMVQCRGYGNRLPNGEEQRILRRFAEQHGFEYNPKLNRW